MASPSWEVPTPDASVVLYCLGSSLETNAMAIPAGGAYIRHCDRPLGCGQPRQVMKSHAQLV